MKRQRNMFQTKEQDKTPEEELSEGEMGSLHEKVFRVRTVKMIKERTTECDTLLSPGPHVIAQVAGP